MPSKSKIKLLPSPLRDLINDLLQKDVRLDDIMAKLRELGVTAQLNLELMHSVIFDLVAGGENGEGVQIDAKEASFLAGALKDLAGARKTEADFVFRIRQETAKAVTAAAAKEVDAVGAQQGLTAQTVNAIKARILGVKVPETHA